MTSDYVLIADDDQARVATCLDVFGTIAADIQVAGTTRDALAFLARRGTPRVLVLNATLPQDGAFAVCDALPSRDRARVPVVLWTASRATRELARVRLGGMTTHLLQNAVRPSVLRAVAARTRRQTQTAPSDREELAAILRERLRQATRLFDASGAAVYWRMPGDTQFRSAFEWADATLVVDTPSWLPYVLETVMDNGQPLFIPDLAVRSFPGMPATTSDRLRACAAVPVQTHDGDVCGMLCVFGLAPFVDDEIAVIALRALGRLPTASAHREEAVPQPERPLRRAPPPAPGPAVDPATALLDRTHGVAAIHREVARARRERRPLGVIVFNIDPTASRPGIVGKLRASDLAIEWDPQQLVVVLTSVAPGDARSVAKRLHAALHVATNASIAGGVSDVLPHEPFDTVLARAQEKMRLVSRRGHHAVA